MCTLALLLYGGRFFSFAETFSSAIQIRMYLREIVGI